MTGRLTCLILLLATPAAADLDDTIGSVQRAFQESSAESLRSLLVDGKVYLAVPAVRDGEGPVGTHQVYYHFRDFFAAHPTQSFEVKNTRSERDSADVLALWTYRGDDGPSRVDLLLTLVAEGDSFRVRVLRDLAR